MKTNPILRISIPQPCNQNWDAMQNAGEGKHCNQCNKVVYDFSQMNDDEVLHFFKQQATIPCGRFHNSQLNRDILPVGTRKKLFITRFNKIAAALFAVLSFKSFSATANNKNVKPIVEVDGNYKNNFTSGSDKIIISGIVKDSEGKPIENAKITFDSLHFTSNAEGKFSFTIEEVTPVNHTIYFEYGDLIPVVRNYHPAMLSTSYDVVLNKRGESYSMGMIPPPSWRVSEMPDDFPSLSFKTSGYKLDGNNKAMLATVAAKLKSYPNGKIIVYTYPSGAGPQYMYNKRVENIKIYLVEKEGITADRIMTMCELGGGDKNVVDIKSDN